jgi:predicted DNA-binding transcriptional regulator AlpA
MTTALDTFAAAEKTGLAASTLRKLRLTGEGPRFLKLGRAVRYRESDLEDWLEQRAVQSTSETPQAKANA